MCLSNQIVSCFNRVKSLLTKYFRVRTYKANIIENHLSSLTIQYREKAYWHLFPPHFGIHTFHTFHTFKCQQVCIFFPKNVANLFKHYYWSSSMKLLFLNNDLVVIISSF